MNDKVVQIGNAVAVRHGLDKLVGSSHEVQVVYEKIDRVASLSVPVLITGESGTGKELVARAIHNVGNRAKEPFVAVSCGAIPESLIEAELFGYEKGAFTGSSGTRIGYLEQAGRGTLLLDEIGELSLNTQVKLLRVLQEREFCRLGSGRPIPLLARVLFATHRDLRDLVDKAKFRSDLYYRVNVIGVNVPALRCRRDDIPMLARYFINRYAAEQGKDAPEISRDAMRLLVEYEWPGNIRELENVIQQALIFCDGAVMGPHNLPAEIINEEFVCEDEDAGGSSYDDLVRRFKATLARNTILACGGNKSEAARKLGVSRAYIHRLIGESTAGVA